MGNNCVSINLKKDQIVVKIAEDAEQKRIISELSRKISDLKKLYKDEKTPIRIVGKVLKNKEIDEMVASENLSDEETRKIIEEYEYSGKLRDDDIKQSFNEDIGFLERRHKVSLLKSKIIDLVDKFALV